MKGTSPSQAGRADRARKRQRSAKMGFLTTLINRLGRGNHGNRNARHRSCQEHIRTALHCTALHGVDAAGKVVLQRPAVKRAKLLELTASLTPCLIGMEACSGAHHWARQMTRQGHTVRLIAPKFVAPYRMSGKRGKNDAADAAAICEAVARPAMRFVPVKNIAQQSELFLHRARQGYVEQRTALINRVRGLLSELGIVLPQNP